MLSHTTLNRTHLQASLCIKQHNGYICKGGTRLWGGGVWNSVQWQIILSHCKFNLRRPALALQTGRAVIMYYCPIAVLEFLVFTKTYSHSSFLSIWYTESYL